MAKQLVDQDAVRQHGLSHASLMKLKQELDQAMSKFGHEFATAGNPNDGRSDERIRAFSQRVKDWLIDWFRRTTEEAAKVNLATYLAPESELADIPADFYKLRDFIERQAEQLKAIQAKL